jgi:hypothetical protein
MRRHVRTLLGALLAVAMAAPGALADDQKDDAKKTPAMSPEARLLPDEPGPEMFGKQPVYPDTYDADAQLAIYGGKHMNRTAFPPVDLGLGLYERGAYDPRPTLFGAKNPVLQAFMAYGDLRVAGATYDNGVPGANGKTDHREIAARLNLDMDLQLTATERFHAFVRPLDRNGSFTRLQFGDTGGQDRFIHELNFNVKTLFFEGDFAAIGSGLHGAARRYDRPFALGRVPIATQNGIWIEDAIDGAAVSVFTAKNSARFDISNMDLTVFAGLRNVATAAVPGTTDSHLFGIAGFADMLRGYVEWGYGYLDAKNSDLSYHNVTASFTRRYRGLVSNSVRVIGNLGQKGIPGQPKTADGALLLVENSLITSKPLTLVPYANFFAGFRSPQSLARGGDSGGVLRNTGINFESDGLTGYPTLDASARDSYGGALGLEYLFNLHRQIVVEGAVVERRNGSNPFGNQYAIGARYQHPITNAWIVRLDAMRGWRQGQKDIYGARLEIRRKF